MVLVILFKIVISLSFDLICFLRLIRIIITWKRILVSVWHSVEFSLAHQVTWPTTEAIQAIRVSSSNLRSCEYCTEVRKDTDCKPSAVRTEGADYRGGFCKMSQKNFHVYSDGTLLLYYEVITCCLTMATWGLHKSQSYRDRISAGHDDFGYCSQFIVAKLYHTLLNSTLF